MSFFDTAATAKSLTASAAPTSSIYLGKSDFPQQLLLKYANRHGLIAGATGTGKTLTLQGLAEGFSKAGVPVFIADIKGDLSGMCQPGRPKEPLVKRAAEIGYDYQYFACPTVFWDVFGKNGHPVRTTISEMGPMLLSRLLELNDTQEGVLSIVFAVADAQGMLLLDFDDLRAMLIHVSDNAREYSAQYGNVAPASVAAIQRSLLALEQQGAKNLFGEPALDIADFMQVAPNGMGAVNIFCAEGLMNSPKLYAMFMLWLMAELFEDMPEMGDLDKPKLVFFFDEAHLLFNDAPKALVEKIEQLVRLIRSKGVGVYFITQNPADIPDSVLAQLSNRVQHALRAFTPADQKGVRAAAQTFRPNPAFKTEEAITILGVGEALVSTLDEKGTPTIVARTLIKPPSSLAGPCAPQQRGQVMSQSPVSGKYDNAVNRESAYEMLNKKTQEGGSLWGNVTGSLGMGGGNSSTPARPAPRGRQPESIANVMVKNVARAAASQIGRQIARGILSSMLKGR
ncbi:MAG: DUF853 domain-containing protein [Rickettsiales bacterium]|jgi:hypothetical protein|nr:DUF853 domain-containing protein [Rickettsiales bacterium]